MIYSHTQAILDVYDILLSDEYPGSSQLYNGIASIHSHNKAGKSRDIIYYNRVQLKKESHIHVT